MNDNEWIVSEWAARFADVMHTMAESTFQTSFTPFKQEPPAELLWWKQSFSCSPDAFLWVGAGEQQWSAVGQAVLTSAGVESPPPEELRSSYIEILRQSLAGLADEFGTRISAEVSCGEGAEEGPGLSSALTFEVSAEIAGSPVITFYLAVSGKLTAAAAIPAPPSVIAAREKSSEAAPLEHRDNLTGSRTFDLLLDVELPLSVSFGHATLRVQDAMNLINGSLVELDRALSDPVDLLVNNCVIARGEVVVIEGNYGVRLTEIVSHNERLQHGKRHQLG